MNLQPMETAPKDATYVLLAGPSGYTGTPLRVLVCKYDAEFRPRQPWVTFSGDSFLDSGGPPTGWAPLPGSATVQPGYMGPEAGVGLQLNTLKHAIIERRNRLLSPEHNGENASKYIMELFRMVCDSADPVAVKCTKCGVDDFCWPADAPSHVCLSCYVDSAKGGGS